jgi:phospholipase C
MSRTMGVALCCLLLFIGLFLLSLNGCGSSGTSSPAVVPPPTNAQQIQHIVIIFQENRSPDNLFQDPKLIAAGADIKNVGVASGTNVPLSQIPLSCAPGTCTNYNPDHSHQAFINMYDNGNMDGVWKNLVNCAPSDKDCNPPPYSQYAFVNPSDVAPYFQMAETYTFADRMFQTNQGPSFPAHQFIISGTSAPTAPGAANSDTFAAENPGAPGLGPGPAMAHAGCIALPNETVKLISPSGDESQSIYPCFEHPTLTDQLDNMSISWRYYAPSAGFIWTAPNAIQHMCVPNAPVPNATACTGSDWVNNVVLQDSSDDTHTPNAVLSDIANGNLASVVWVIPSGQASDHPVNSDGSGPFWVSSIVNAIGNSQYWAHTAIILTWDDWGGWYDHVPPPAIINSYEYGFRVPMIIISPYAKPAFISHTVYDFGSILRFIEQTFKVGQVAPQAATAYADALTLTGDLSDCFDFTQTPLTFQTIPASLPASASVGSQAKEKPSDPDDD